MADKFATRDSHDTGAGMQDQDSPAIPRPWDILHAVRDIGKIV